MTRWGKAVQPPTPRSPTAQNYPDTDEITECLIKTTSKSRSSHCRRSRMNWHTAPGRRGSHFLSQSDGHYNKQQTDLALAMRARTSGKSSCLFCPSSPSLLLRLVKQLLPEQSEFDWTSTSQISISLVVLLFLPEESVGMYIPCSSQNSACLFHHSTL